MAKVIIIGAGAAGMIAAGKAAENGNEVHLYEKNSILGKKINITGKGRCNITNASNIDSFLENIPGNPYFLYSALYAMDSSKLIEFFNGLGLETKVERGNRVFPVSDKANDVTRVLEKYMNKNKVNISLNMQVDSLLIKYGLIDGIKLKNGKEINADSIIIATGGLSYPGTGSTGDGYKFAKSVGHTVTKLHPSLVSLRARESFCNRLMGLSLKNVAVTFKNFKGKVLYKDFGEMLFTHFGVSGPVILSGSRRILSELNKDCKILIDLKPALDENTLDLRILRDFEKYKNKDLKNSLDDLFPKKLIPIIIELSGINPDKKINNITKVERKKIISLMKNFELTIYQTGGYDEAVVTNGGVCVSEINPSTMESKIVNGLYFAGEVIDVDGYTGGYNLQIAFSTGYLAGDSV